MSLRYGIPIPRGWSLATPERVHIPDWGWEHEVRVALPPSYDRVDQSYPALWVTDNNLETALPIAAELIARGSIPEMILVGVGAPLGISDAEWRRRRTFDFTPGRDDPTRPDEMGFSGPQGEVIRTKATGQADTSFTGGGAAKFLRFLAEDLRDDLGRRYRMAANEHGLVGTSGGGMFVGFAIFGRPSAFSYYLCGSPTLNVNNWMIFDLEDEYAASHGDLPARLFFIAGEGEITEAGMADWGIVSSMVRMVETLRVRKYPSLLLSVRVMPNALHEDIWQPLVEQGLVAVWSPPA